jgi:hypothetical protein
MEYCTYGRYTNLWTEYWRSSVTTGSRSLGCIPKAIDTALSDLPGGMPSSSWACPVRHTIAEVAALYLMATRRGHATRAFRGLGAEQSQIHPEAPAAERSHGG